MLFEDKSTMAAQKERQFTVRMDDATYDYLIRKSGLLDVTRSELIRTALLVAVPQIESIPSLLKVQLDDIRGEGK